MEIPVEVYQKIKSDPSQIVKNSLTHSAPDSKHVFPNHACPQSEIPIFESLITKASNPPGYKELKQNPFAFKNSRRLLTRDYKIKKKTELCTSFKSTGTCKYGDNCAFAHGEHELQKKVHVPSMYKTKLCQSFHFNGYCPYGHRCQFIHSENLGGLLKLHHEQEEIRCQISFSQMLSENAACISERIRSSHNPYLNEFNLVYKQMNSRLSVF